MVTPRPVNRPGFIQPMGGDASTGTSFERPEDWRKRALCSDDPDIDPDDFYDETQYEFVRAVCMRCPVREACLNEFTGDKWAFAGGMTPDERKKYARTGEEPKVLVQLVDRREFSTDERVLALVALGAGYDLISERLNVTEADAKALAAREGVSEPEYRPRTWKGKDLSKLARQILIGLYCGDAPRVVGDAVGSQTAVVVAVRSRLMYDDA